MSLALSIGVVGLATLVLVVYEAICMMRLRRITSDRPRSRELLQMAFRQPQDAPPEARPLARRVVAARLASYVGIAGVMILLLSL